MNLLAFAALPHDDDDTAADRLDGLKGLFQRAPYAAVMIAIAMLSLAGIPPFPGFVAKFLIFKNVMAAGYTTYAVLGLIGSYLGIYFYLRVIQYMFMSAEVPVAAHSASRRLALSASLLCVVPAVLLSVFPRWVIGQL
jgi:NADH-quinone oxidoreductase subunit N